MDSDRQLKAELGRALDEVLPPVPWLEAAVTDDLRKRRSRKSVDRSPGMQQRSRWSPGPAMQFAAGLLVLALAAAAVVTMVELRNREPQTAPAGSLSIEAYQNMVKLDDGQLIVSRDKGCNDLQSVCPAPPRPITIALQRWLDDLNRSEPPARFALIDAQLRRHVAWALSDVDAVFAAHQAKDQAALDRAYNLGQQGWLDEVTRGIAESHPGTAAAYVASVRAGAQAFGGCVACQSLASQVDCTVQDVTCEYETHDAIETIGPFQAALVRVSAPNSLAAQDVRLQNDLAQADTAVLAVADAQLRGDQAAFNAGRLSLQHALPAINADVAGILGA